MVATIERMGKKMAGANGPQPTGNYRLYRASMDRLVKIAALKRISVADLCEPILAQLADAEYMSTLNEEMEAERERQKLIDQQRKKKG